MIEKALRIESKAEKCVAVITQALNNAGITDACYAVRLRVKNEERLTEKVKRKRERDGKPEYQVESITDVIGIRLITLFRSELIAVLEKVMDLIDHKIALLPHPLKKDSLEELIVYSTQSEDSTFITGIKERLARRDQSFNFRHSREGYSSLHVVCRIAPNTIDCSAIGEGYMLPVEIQIRTVFEDAWGEIDHKYGYLARSGKFAADAQSSQLTAPHLLVLKEFTEACASYADVIKQISRPVNKVSIAADKVRSVSADDDVLSRFRQLRVPESYVEAYITGRVHRDAGTEVSLSNVDAAKRYAEAYTYFEDLHKSAEDTDFPEPAGKKLYLYYMALNSAFCLLSIGTPNSLDRAIIMYTRLINEYGGYCMVKMRLSQALAKCGRHGDAIVTMENLLADVEARAALPKQTGKWPDELPKVDFDFISHVLPKVLGYQYWLKAEFRTPMENRDERLTLFKQAYEVTEQAADAKSDVIQNNLAYYAVAYLRLERSDAFAKELLGRLGTYVSVLEKAAATPEGAEDVRQLDTLLEIYEYTNNSKAKDLARLIGKKLQDGQESDPHIYQRISMRVLNVLMAGAESAKK